MLPAAKTRFAIAVAALGYFVDVYDLLLFGILRGPSLSDLGLGSEAVLSVGARILNMQMLGMLVGGVLWGVLGDKRGRVSVLFGSILLYSLATLANAFVTTTDQYGWLRFVAGIGLAGELGAGITLVVELLPNDKRGLATTLVASTGIIGAVVATYVGQFVSSWRTCYVIGGVLGLVLLLLRVGTLESGMFAKLQSEHRIERGNLLQLLWPIRRLLRFVAIILVGIPIWYGVSIPVTFAPEIGVALGLSETPSAAIAIRYCYVGLVLGDIGSGLLSQYLQRRRIVVGSFVLLLAVAVLFYFTLGGRSSSLFYWLCGAIGFAGGYWAVFITIAAEQFGTNLRATVTTSAPNFVRGAVALIVPLFAAWKPELGVVGAALAVGAITIALALVAVAMLEETFSKDLDFLER
jgi:predicted MFS family arabinose efflux permease